VKFIDNGIANYLDTKMKEKIEFPKITIRKIKDRGNIMCGANTEVLVDGKPLHGVKSIDFKVDSTSLAEVNIRLIGNVEIEGEIGKISVLVDTIDEGKNE